MKQVKIHTDERAAMDRLDRIKSAVPMMQDAADKLKALGAESISIRDIQSVATADNTVSAIKSVILKGKDLRVSGLSIDPAQLKFPEAEIRELAISAKKIDPSNYNVKWHHYEMIDGRVSVCDCVAGDCLEEKTTYGTPRAAEIIEDVQKFCDQANAIAKKLDLHSHHPLRDPAGWMQWNSLEKTFSPDIHKIAGQVK